MGKALRISKVLVKNGIYYYYVNDFGLKPCIFYIGIDPEKKLVHFFKNQNFEKAIGIMDFNESDYLPEILGLKRAVTNMVGYTAFIVIQDNNFPQELGRYS